jgi:hypothetical protein
VSRAARRYKKWERDTRNSAWEESRLLALDLYCGQVGPVNAYGVGVALEPGEVLYRQIWARYWTLGEPLDLVNGSGGFRFVPSVWRDWGWCLTVLTSHRLVTRLGADGGRLISNWWASIGGVQVDLSRDLVTLDDRTSSWRGAYGGPAVAIVSVGAISAVHGVAALVEHPALAPLRQAPSSLRAPTK